MYKGQLKGFPKEVVEKMLYEQEQQGNERDVSVFERDLYDTIDKGGFNWNETKDGAGFWSQVISTRDFDLFFQKYPKTDKKFPRKMLVWDDLKECASVETVYAFIPELNEPYIVEYGGETR